MTWMKKSLAACLVLCLGLALCGCDKSEKDSVDPKQDQATILSCIALLGAAEEELVSQMGEGQRTLLDGTQETLFREYALSLFGQSIPFMATIDLGHVLDISATLDGSYDDWVQTIKASLGEPTVSDDEQTDIRESRWAFEGGGLALIVEQETSTLSFYKDGA